MRTLILLVVLAGIGASFAYHFLHRPAVAPLQTKVPLSEVERRTPVPSLEERAAAAQGTVYPEQRPDPPARRQPSERPESTASQAVVKQPAELRCDGRERCPQMHSCEEATWFLNNCPNTKMDGDHDGVPCEDQWCPHS